MSREREMSTNWLVAVDSSDFGSQAFDYITKFFNPKTDCLYITNVVDQPGNFSYAMVSYMTMADTTSLGTVRELEEERAKKVLVHYGDKAKKLGLEYSLLRGKNLDLTPGEVICKAVKKFGVHNCVVGRRELGYVQRLFTGSVSMYVLEHAECNVIVVKKHVENVSPDKTAQEIPEEKSLRLEAKKRFEMSDEDFDLYSVVDV